MDAFTHAIGGLTAFYGAGTGLIYLDDVACTLSVSQLLECSSRPILAHNCDHRDDAGVKCEGMFCFLLLLFNPKTLKPWKLVISATRKVAISAT